MRRTLIALGVLAFLALSAATVLACGDKLLALGAGMRSQELFRAAHPAAILFFTRPNSAVAQAVKDPQLLPAFKQAGHKIQNVEESGKLEDALKTGKYDLIVADVADAESLSAAIQGAASHPLFVPVVSQANKADQTAAHNKFHCLMKAPNKPGSYLSAIDEAMKWRLKNGSGPAKSGD